MDLLQTLKNLGIEVKEASVYLALLKLKETTATKIAETTNLDRTLIYQLTNKLIERGLVAYVIKNNVKYFSAANPNKLIQDIKEKENQLHAALPELIALTKEEDKETKVEVYRGKEGIKTILREILRNKKDYVVFGEEGKLQETFPIEFEWFLKDIVKLGIKERVLVREDLRNIAWKTKNSDFRFLPKEYLSPALTVIYGNKVAIFIWKEPYYVSVILNKQVADSFRSYFELLWKIAKK